MAVKISQGAIANKSGRTAEDTIYCIFRERGYKIDKQVTVGRSIYGSPIKCDLVVRGLTIFPDGLGIESKWQQSGGSADEKFPYLVENIKSGIYRMPVIVMADGGGARDAAINWLKKQVDGNCLYGVFSFAELLTWINNNI